MTDTLTDAVAQILEADDAISRAGPRPFPLPIGSHAPIVAGAVSALSRGDWWIPGLRERVGGVLRGASVEQLADASRGARPYKILPSGASPALRAIEAVGLAASNADQCAVVHVGTGALGEGHWHAALNLAGLLRPNVVFVLALHTLGEGAPLGPQTSADPAQIAAAHGLAVLDVDGSVAEAVHDAVKAAREARGPHLVIARLQQAALPDQRET